MKQVVRNFLPTLLGALVILPSSLAMAGGNESAHGGDTQCDARIQVITDQIAGWIRGQGARVGELNLSSSLNPSTRRPYTVSEYENAMVSVLSNRLDASCVQQGDPEYPVQVGGSAKVCKNSIDAGRIHLVCDLNKFLAMTADERIQQIHHEFATDVPGLEPDEGPLSTYKISNQLSAFIRDMPERKLVVAQRRMEQGLLLKYVGEGSMLIVKKDLYLPPGEDKVGFAQNADSFCNVKLKKKSNKLRILSAAERRVLNVRSMQAVESISGAVTDYYHPTAGFYVGIDDPVVESMYCWFFQARDTVTIENFESGIWDGAIETKLASTVSRR